MDTCEFVVNYQQHINILKILYYNTVIFEIVYTKIKYCAKNYHSKTNINIYNIYSNNKCRKVIRNLTLSERNYDRNTAGESFKHCVAYLTDYVL